MREYGLEELMILLLGELADPRNGVPAEMQDAALHLFAKWNESDESWDAFFREEMDKDGPTASEPI